MKLNAVALVLLFLFSLSACAGDEGASTPTPTKTPEPAGVEQPAETATPPPSDSAGSANTTSESGQATATPVPGRVARYTGLPLADPSLLQEAPIFVCLNNDVDSRASHYGLNEADVTYEYIVDGFHLTRLTSMYQSIPAREIGPVRSARWPNRHTTYMFDGILACSGGSDGIRYLLKNEVGFPYLDADSVEQHAEAAGKIGVQLAHERRQSAPVDNRHGEDVRRVAAAALLPGYFQSVAGRAEKQSPAAGEGKLFLQ